MERITVVFILSLATSVLAANDKDSNSLAAVTKHIKTIAEELRNASKQAGDIIVSVNEDVAERINASKVKLFENIQKMKGRVEEAVVKLLQKLTSTESEVVSCFESHRKLAEQVFNETYANTVVCVDQRSSEIKSLLGNLKVMADNASALSYKAMYDLKNCTKENDIISAGACIGAAALSAEWKAATMLPGIGVELARVNWAIGTLPAALDVCAAQRLVEAGYNTGKVLVAIGACSASNLWDHLTTRKP